MPCLRLPLTRTASAMALLVSVGACRGPETPAGGAAPTPVEQTLAGSAHAPVQTAHEGSTDAIAEPSEPDAETTAPDDVASLPGEPTPLAAPTAQTVAGHTVTATRCTVEGTPLSGPIGLDTVRDLEVVGDRLWLADADGNVRRYAFTLGQSCVLRPDPAFGVAGVLDLDRDIDALSSDTTGRLVASSGVFESWAFSSTTAEPSRCTATSHGFLSLAPDGSYAIGRFIGRDLTRVTFAADGCTASPEPASVHFLSIQAVAFVGPNRLHGGMISEDAPTARPHQVIAYAPNGDVAWRQGNLDDPFADDAYSTIGAIEAGSEGAVVLDPTTAALHLLDDTGVHLGRVGLELLTGVPAPAVGALEVQHDGSAFLGVAARRDGEIPAWDAYVFHVTGL